MEVQNKNLFTAISSRTFGVSDVGLVKYSAAMCVTAYLLPKCVEIVISPFGKIHFQKKVSSYFKKICMISILVGQIFIVIRDASNHYGKYNEFSFIAVTWSWVKVIGCSALFAEFYPN